MSLLLNMARKLLHTVSESRAFGDLRSEYQSKPIIKYGVWFGIAIVAFYVVLIITDEANLLERDLQQMSTRLSKVEQVQAEDFWFERLEFEEKNANKLQKSLRIAETSSLAKAQIQTYLTSFSEKWLEQSSINVSNPIFLGNYYGRDVYTVSAELRGRVRKGKAVYIFDNLARMQYVQEVDRLSIEFQRNRQMTLITKSYFFIQEPL